VNHQQPPKGDPSLEASGIRPYVAWLRFLPLGLIVLGVGWVFTHPLASPTNAATSGTIVGNVNSVDPADLVAHPARTLPPAPVRTATPHLQVAANDLGAAGVTPAPVQGASGASAPVAPDPPAAAATMSPAAIAAQRRAEEDEAARDAPLVSDSSATTNRVAAAPEPTRAAGYDVAPPAGPFLGPGTEIDVTLYTSIDSTVPGMITGFVGRDVLDFYKRVVLIPARSKVVGHMATTSLQPGQNRIGVVWEGILLPNGHEITLEGAPGIDLTGTTGFGATIDNHTRKEIVNVIAFSLLAAGAQLAQPQNVCNSNGYGGCTPSVGQAVGQAFGTQIANLATQAYNRSSQIQPTAHVVEGAQVGVMITGYLPLRPWDPSAQ
jgi:type IV secretory pathway VirB10-like protein